MNLTNRACPTVFGVLLLILCMIMGPDVANAQKGPKGPRIKAGSSGPRRLTPSLNKSARKKSPRSHGVKLKNPKALKTVRAQLAKTKPTLALRVRAKSAQAKKSVGGKLNAGKEKAGNLVRAVRAKAARHVAAQAEKLRSIGKVWQGVGRGRAERVSGELRHGFKYHPRIRARGLQDPRAHSFPYSFDKAILKQRPIKREDGSLMHRMKGTMNGKKGHFEIAVNPNTKTIFHRTFVGN